MIYYTLLFIAYFALTSILHRLVNVSMFQIWSRKTLLMMYRKTLGPHRFFTRDWWRILFMIKSSKAPKERGVLFNYKNTLYEDGSASCTIPEPVSITEWAQKPRYIPPYLKNAVDQIRDDKVEKVVLLQGKDREAFIRGVQCSGQWFLIHPDGTQEEIDENRISSAGMAEFKQQCLSNPWPPAKKES